MCCVRILLSLLLLTSSGLIAQDGRGGGRQGGGAPAGPPKNLRVLPADTNIQEVMGTFRAALGVQCTYCHVAGDFASDDNPKKNMARNMIRIAGDINAAFPDGKRHVTCYTCHRGEDVPKTEPPAPGETPAPGRGRGRGR
jgi:Photosynthetic reaction centre cytochrome C subunit